MNKISNNIKSIATFSQNIFDDLVTSANYQKIGDLSSAGVSKLIQKELNNLVDNRSTTLIQFTGAPGSGKTTLINKVYEKLKNSIIVSTDDYNIGTREERKNNLNNGGKTIDNKNFALFKEHILKLKTLRANEKLYLPEDYDPGTGYALIKGLKREVVGSFDHILIDGNFYIGNPEVAGLTPSAVFYIHMNDKDRLKIRLIRDLVPGKMRGKDENEILYQFITRHELEDKPHTIPYMNCADVLIQTYPHFSGNEIEDFTYEVFLKNN